MYLQTLIRDTSLSMAVWNQVTRAEALGYIVNFAQGEVQRNLFTPQEDVFVTLEVEKK